MAKQQIIPVDAKVFTRENPCDKVDLYLCFFGSDGKPRRRAVVEARGEIGLNAIKYLLREEYAIKFEESGVDWWELTAEGKEWLTAGLTRHLELHPEHANRLQSSKKTSAPARRRRTR